MGTTGWLGEAPDEVPPMPVTQMMLARQERRAGPLEVALARSRADEIREAREAAANAPDPDERAASFVSRGYTPGLLNELAQRLGDTTAELEAERDKLEKAARRAQFAAREHAAGRADVSRMLAMMDGDDGDASRVAMLERRAESLRRQIAEAQNMIAAPQQRDPEPGGGGQPRRARGVPRGDPGGLGSGAERDCPAGAAGAAPFRFRFPWAQR